MCVNVCMCVTHINFDKGKKVTVNENPYLDATYTGENKKFVSERTFQIIRKV